HPAVDLAPEQAPAGHSIGRGKVRIERDRAVEQRQRFIDGRAGAQMEVRHSAQVIIIGIETLGGLALRTRDLGLFELRREGANHARRDLVLQVENIVERAFETVGPEVGAGRRVDELAGDAYTLRGSANAALEHIAHPELTADLLDVHAAALESKRG